MEDPPASLTAVVSALMRAAHLQLDDEPKIFRDPLAIRLAGISSEQELRTAVADAREAIAADLGRERADEVLRYMRSVMTLRSRYTEDELAAALEAGTRQYVILGAGLDSYAYRTDPVPGLRVFEVDLPSTQRAKRARLAELGIDEPESVVFVAADLQERPLLDALREGGFDPSLPAFISWLGTTQYLREEAVFSTLRQIASLAPGTELVFQYQLDPRLLEEPDRFLFDAISDRARHSGEPWLTTFEPEPLAARVTELGFTDVVDFGREDAAARYFGDRTDGLRPPGMSRLMQARVGTTGPA